MDKFRNIFWHEGAKLYEDKEIEKDKEILKKVQHLENDVTKSLLNVLEYTDKKVTDGLIKKINRENATDISFCEKPLFDF